MRPSFRKLLALASVGAAALGILLPVTAAGAATTKITIRTVEVQAVDEWPDSGIYLSRGDAVAFYATGKVAVVTNGPLYGPTGGAGCITGPGVYGGNWAANGFPCWSLIGKIGANGTPFEIGNATSILVRDPGELYLTVDDNYYPDNSGYFKVLVTAAGL
jgi:hypothetical protein